MTNCRSDGTNKQGLIRHNTPSWHWIFAKCRENGFWTTVVLFTTLCWKDVQSTHGSLTYIGCCHNWTTVVFHRQQSSTLFQFPMDAELQFSIIIIIFHFFTWELENKARISSFYYSRSAWKNFLSISFQMQRFKSCKITLHRSQWHC